MVDYPIIVEGKGAMEVSRFQWNSRRAYDVTTPTKHGALQVIRKPSSKGSKKVKRETFSAATRIRSVCPGKEVKEHPFSKDQKKH